MSGQQMMKIEAYQRPDKSVFYRISLQSDVRPQCKMYGDVEDVDDNKSYKAGAIGGFLASQQNLFYGDTHNPTQCAKAAEELLRDILGDKRMRGRIKSA